MSVGCRLLLIGLKGSGKTSYLAALWHSVESGEVETSLRVANLQPDREYLNRVRDLWLRLQEMGRTSSRSPQEVSLHLNDAMSGEAIDLTLPDLSGELFRQQWITRKATRHFANFAAESSGVILFIHPTDLVKSQRISFPEGHQGSQSSDQIALEWSPETSPTQAILVELLQFVAHLKSTTTSGRIAVIISAWDLVKEPIPPTSWLETHLPLLYQFLVANGASTPFQIYGVSALGGDLEKDFSSLREESIPGRRIRVIEEAKKPHGDLTAPIRFLLSADGST